MGSDLCCLPNLIVDIIAAFYLCANKQINETAELDLVGLCWPPLTTRRKNTIGGP